MQMSPTLISQPVFLNQGEVEQKRAEIKAYFNQTWENYESLFETLVSDETFYLRPCSLRHPLIFYFGHTATFFTNKLVLAKLLPQRINPSIEALCAIGVDEMSWDDLNDAHYDWPSVAAVRAYRNEVKEAVNELIDQVAFSLPIDWQSPMWPIMMGIEHERIHLETSSVLIRQLPIDQVKPHPLFPICADQQAAAPTNRLLAVPAGEVKIAHQDPAPHYGWDNEYGQHQANVPAFQASEFLVSNAEFLAFVEAGGYNTAEFWDEEGDRWRQFSPVKHPSFWVRKTEGDQQAWYLRCMTEEIPMPWSWPAEVNHLEAAAFCRWKAAQTGQPIRLPSEDEYLRLRDHTQAQQHLAQANINLQQAASSCPVTRCKQGEFYDVIGNVWQWTETPIHPFEGFKVHPLYDDFTTPTFDNKHNIIKGGSWISTGNEINGSSRYAFRRHFFQHAGFRYIASDAPVQKEFSTYETDSAVAQYCEFHFGDEYFGVANFAKAYADLAIGYAQTDADLAKREHLKVLEVGCSVGRASFELAKHFERVVGLDFSARFINVANQLQTTGQLRYTLPIEGEIMDFKETTLAQLGLNEVASRCEFLQQDATNMKPIFSGYDMIVAMNLIDRLYEPKKFLTDVAGRLNSGGLLMLGSPYTWLEEFTQKAHWLGGYKDAQSGENVTTLETLHALLSKDFEPVGEPQDLPFVIRETARKYQHTVSQVTLWKKKA
ncbi:5-histidylcysteine sulfoxide synthase [Thiomicrospira sp. ALE5]|uniref:5-histidylcysteine sulfoxide synthase n=1 Tax=Thiomicrospira sp. ALE5 TaxID=748650 RepID=UPI0008E6FDA3|nr:5-histidylcysteine sulfoxide synthase [Thiomicrospira sp. ALE5]SFR63750.1 5-histidylcysteine sulfoxide synthase/putative 4-mercaptohistidine N1-methyltranferase [Thiomicrospira sp. ALE5]